MLFTWRPVIGFQGLTIRNIGQKRRIRRYFRPISGQKIRTKGDGLHGRGFKQFHVSQSLHVPVAYTSDIKLLGAKDVLIVPCECFGRWPQLF